MLLCFIVFNLSLKMHLSISEGKEIIFIWLLNLKYLLSHSLLRHNLKMPSFTVMLEVGFLFSFLN